MNELKCSDFLLLQILNNQFINELKLILEFLSSIKALGLNINTFDRKKKLLSQVIGPDQLDKEKLEKIKADFLSIFKDETNLKLYFLTSLENAA